MRVVAWHSCSSAAAPWPRFRAVSDGSAAALRAGLASREHLPRQQLLDRPYVVHKPCDHRGGPLSVAMLARSDAEHSIRPAEIVVGVIPA